MFFDDVLILIGLATRVANNCYLYDLYKIVARVKMFP